MLGYKVICGASYNTSESIFKKNYKNQCAKWFAVRVSGLRLILKKQDNE